MRRSLGVVLVVIAAMAIGRLLTDHFPGQESVADPFVRHGAVGDTLPLRYGDVRVTGVRVARTLDGSDAVVAAGRFLMVDFAYRAKGEPRRFLGLELWDAHGRRFPASDRGSACPQNVGGATGIRMYAMACFDVPRSAIAGSRFRFSLGGYGVDGSDQRRDDLAEVDLGLTRPKAERLWRQNLTYQGFNGQSTRPLDKKPITLEKPSWWDELRG